MFDQKAAISFIKEQALEYKGIDPLAFAIDLMETEYLRPHGPEHHYLTAAALCSAWCNAIGEDKAEHLTHLEKRCELIYPGVCGYFGVCGDVMAVGATYSEMMGVSYFSGKPWHTIADFTSNALQAVADSCVGGPRCCKRTSFATLSAAVKWLSENEIAELTVRDEILCSFSEKNSQCIKKGCVYYG